jgi:hypothetical protein
MIETKEQYEDVKRLREVRDLVVLIEALRKVARVAARVQGWCEETSELPADSTEDALEVDAVLTAILDELMKVVPDLPDWLTDE